MKALQSYENRDDAILNNNLQRPFVAYGRKLIMPIEIDVTLDIYKWKQRESKAMSEKQSIVVNKGEIIGLPKMVAVSSSCARIWNSENKWKYI